MRRLSQKSRLAERFERIRNIDRVSGLISHGRAIHMPYARLDCAAIHDNSRSVVSRSSDNAARHVLVAPGDCNVPIVVLRLWNDH